MLDLRVRSEGFFAEMVSGTCTAPIRHVANAARALDAVKDTCIAYIRQIDAYLDSLTQVARAIAQQKMSCCSWLQHRGPTSNGAVGAQGASVQGVRR